jgi:hypothetical protein
MLDAVARQLEKSILVVNCERAALFFKGGGDKMGNPLSLTTQHQAQTNWCWAAVATSVSQFLDNHGSWTQCTRIGVRFRRLMATPGLSHHRRGEPEMPRHSIISGTWIRWLHVLFLACTVASSACAVRYAVVRESLYRSEESKQDRIALPLDDKSASVLVGLLDTGVRRDAAATTPNRKPENDPIYGSLLQALRSTDSLDVDLSKPGKRFCDIAVKLCGHTRVFRGRPATFDVIDARERQPVFPYPIAVSDGRFWWIFYHHQDKNGRETLQQVLVTRIPAKKVVSNAPPG